MISISAIAIFVNNVINNKFIFQNGFYKISDKTYAFET